MPEVLEGNEFVDLVEIGRGGYGIVYRAQQPSFHRTVAIKVLTNIDDATRRRFASEGQALGAVSSHPHIPEVFGSGVTPAGSPYLAMAFMEGGSFGDRISGGDLVPWSEAIVIGVKLAGALETAHRSGVLHRDIKPDNVLISTFGEPQLADFGIAAVEGITMTRTGTTPHSLLYAAPEVLNSRKPTVPSDVYSLGATLFSLISGFAPFWRETDDSIVALVVRTAQDPLPDLRPNGVPDRLCRVLERATAKGMEDRYQTAGEFGEALRSVQAEMRLPVTDMVLQRAPSGSPSVLAPAAHPAVHPIRDDEADRVHAAADGRAAADTGSDTRPETPKPLATPPESVDHAEDSPFVDQVAAAYAERHPRALALPYAALAVGAVGPLLVWRSLFGVDWGDKDFPKLAHFILDAGATNAFTRAYLDVGYIIGLVAAVVGVASIVGLAFRARIPHLRTAMTAVLGLFAAWHLAVCLDLDGELPQIGFGRVGAGAYLGAVGYLACVGGIQLVRHERLGDRTGLRQAGEPDE